MYSVYLSPLTANHSKGRNQCGDTFQIELEFRSVGFLRRRENRSTRRKTSRSKGENQQQTQPTYDAESGNRTRATLVGGECSHHCVIPAPHFLLWRHKTKIQDNYIEISFEPTHKCRRETL